MTALPNLKARVVAQFPVSVAGAGGIKVSKTAGVWTIEPDFSVLDAVLPSVVTDPSSKQIWLYDPEADTYSVMTLAGLGEALYTATSTTSLEIGTGSKTFIIQEGKGFSVGSFVLGTSDASALDYMLGQVTEYSGTSLTLNINQFGGDGTHADWTLRLSAATAPVFGSNGRTRTVTEAGDVTISATDDDRVYVAKTSEAATDVTIPSVSSRIAAGGGAIFLKNDQSNPALYPLQPVLSGTDTLDGATSPLPLDTEEGSWWWPDDSVTPNNWESR